MSDRPTRRLPTPEERLLATMERIQQHINNPRRLEALHRLRPPADPDHTDQTDQKGQDDDEHERD